MRAQATAFLVLAAATAGIAATLAGCGSGGSSRPAAASALATTRQASRQRHGHLTRSPQAPARTAARNSSPPARSSPPTAAPAPSSHPPAPRRSVVVRLTRGLYTDAPDGTPHCVLAFTSPAGSAIRGSVSFLYQDGRVSAAGSYAGTLSASGKIILTLGGKALSGRYAHGRLSLTGCTAALPLAKFAGGCTFTYHGHVP
jgi:hypothetical protein